MVPITARRAKYRLGRRVHKIMPAPPLGKLLGSRLVRAGVNTSGRRQAMFRLRDLRKIALLICVSVSQPAISAEFKKSPIQARGSDLIEVRGDLTLGDEKKFIDVAISSIDAVVVFHSRGGNLFAGIEIGRAIRLKGFSTLVPENHLCASACALAWLAGRSRLMSETGRVGFHAAYSKQNGQPNVSPSANAIVGAYLNQLGLPTSAIVYITSAPPEGMQWLNFGDAQRVGIDVKQLNFAVRGSEPESEPPGSHPSQSAVIDSIKKETQAFVDANNRPNAEALAYLQSKYADKVKYFGKALPKSAALNEKRAFFKKWPDRNYSLNPDSLKIDCPSQTSCSSEAAVNFKISGALLTSAEKATFIYVWTIEDGDWKLNSESRR